jgi:hypothetical protein
MNVLSFRRVGAICAAALGFFAVEARANSLTLTAPDPIHIPDESQPRIVVGDAPVPAFGNSSWQNVANSPGAKKVNAQVTPEELFGHTVAINDIASITYYTKSPVGQENWFVNFYTKPTDANDAVVAAGDDGGFYKHRFFNTAYTSYIKDSAWHNNSITSFTRSSGSGGVSATLGAWQTSYGTELIRFFSPQTNSALNGNDAQIDGLVVTLKNSEIGSVNFDAPAAAPLPTTAWMGLSLMLGMGLVRAYKRYGTRRFALA